MPVRKHSYRAQLVFLCLAAFGTGLSNSQTPTTWWPDPTTGLMWTAESGTELPLQGMNWKDAIQYCSALNLEAYSDWRVPTLEEVNAIIYNQHVLTHHGSAYDVQEFKGGITGSYLAGFIWTSTLSDDQHTWTVAHGILVGHAVDQTYPLTNNASVICVRQMETSLLQLARDAQVVSPVPNSITLKANVSLTKARLAYLTDDYQESLTQSQNALLIKSDFAKAYWGLGISYARLGQWDQAISSLETALKLDNNYEDAKKSLKWAKDGQKAAKKGKQPKEPPPTWNWTLEPEPCYERWINGLLTCSS